MKYSLILTLFVSIFFISCNSSNSNPKIGVLFGYYRAKKWKLEKKHLENKIKELGGIPIIKIADGDELKQITQATELIEQNVDVLIIAAINENNGAAIVRKAKNNNIKVIAYQKMIKNANLDCYISFNSKRVGELMAEYAIQKVPRGNYILLWGDQGDKNAHDIKNGAKNILKPYIEKQKINIVFETFNEGWKEANAYHNTFKAIQFSNKRIDAVIASFSGLAFGAAKAVLKNEIKNKIFVIGHNTNIATCRQILDNQEVFAVFRSPKNIAEKTAETAMLMARNENINFNDSVFNSRVIVPTIILDPVLINKENIQKYIFDGAYLKKEDVLKAS
jgi:D-xylose transport system substrate-binding protein